MPEDYFDQIFKVYSAFIDATPNHYFYAKDRVSFTWKWGDLRTYNFYNEKDFWEQAEKYKSLNNGDTISCTKNIILKATPTKDVLIKRYKYQLFNIETAKMLLESNWIYNEKLEMKMIGGQDKKKYLLIMDIETDNQYVYKEKIEFIIEEAWKSEGYIGEPTQIGKIQSTKNAVEITIDNVFNYSNQNIQLFRYNSDGLDELIYSSLYNCNVIPESSFVGQQSKKNGITLMPVSDEEFVLNGTATENTTFTLFDPVSISVDIGEKYILQGFLKNTIKKCKLSAKEDYNNEIIEYNDCGDGIIFSPKTNEIYIYLEIEKGETFLNFAISPSLRIFKEGENYNPSSNYPFIVCDYKCRNNANYTYILYCDYTDVTKEYFSNYYQIYSAKTKSKESVYTCFKGYTLIDLYKEKDNIYITGDSWTLKYNLEQNESNINLGVTQYDTMGRYSNASYGKKKFETSSISCLLGDVVQDGYTEHDGENNINKLLKWKDFITNGNLKLLKDYKGNMFIVNTVETPNYKIDTNSHNQMTTISFNWAEAKNIDDVIIRDVIEI